MSNLRVLKAHDAASSTPFINGELRIVLMNHEASPPGETIVSPGEGLSAVEAYAVIIVDTKPADDPPPAFIQATIKSNVPIHEPLEIRFPASLKMAFPTLESGGGVVAIPLVFESETTLTGTDFSFETGPDTIDVNIDDPVNPWGSVE